MLQQQQEKYCTPGRSLYLCTGRCITALLCCALDCAASCWSSHRGGSTCPQTSNLSRFRALRTNQRPTPVARPVSPSSASSCLFFSLCVTWGTRDCTTASQRVVGRAARQAHEVADGRRRQRVPQRGRPHLPQQHRKHGGGEAGVVEEGQKRRADEDEQHRGHKVLCCCGPAGAIGAVRGRGQGVWGQRGSREMLAQERQIRLWCQGLAVRALGDRKYQVWYGVGRGTCFLGRKGAG